jgi:hypothetical protein
MNRKRLLEVMKPILSDGGYRDLEVWSEGNKKSFIFFDSNYMVHPIIYYNKKYYGVENIGFVSTDTIYVQ